MRATIKQQRAASKLVENGGNIGKAMIAAGYSKATAKTPQKLTKSKGWKNLMDDLFPDLLLIKKHRELLYAKKIIVDNTGGKRSVIAKIPDNPIVARALDMAYKLKGYYAATKIENNTNPELEAALDRMAGMIR